MIYYDAEERGYWCGPCRERWNGSDAELHVRPATLKEAQDYYERDDPRCWDCGEELKEGRED